MGKCVTCRKDYCAVVHVYIGLGRKAKNLEQSKGFCTQNIVNRPWCNSTGKQSPGTSGVGLDHALDRQPEDSQGLEQPATLHQSLKPRCRQSTL